MPKNSSMRMRTSASLIPTRSFHTARTNFILASTMAVTWSGLADEGSSSQTFSTRAVPSRRPEYGRRGNDIAVDGWQPVARGASRDACARVAAHPRECDPAGDPGDRHSADGSPWRHPARRGDARAQHDV